MKTYFFYHPIFQQHETGDGHPECPERLLAILECIARENIDVVVKEPKQVNTDYLTLVHLKEYVEIILSTKGRKVAFDADTRTSPQTIDAALYAVGAVVDAVDIVLAEKNATAFCAVRPPGHHAESQKAMGFCVFNNVAVAAAYALKHKGLSRILIIDPDVHHGNGTEEIFYRRKDVFYVSIHQSHLFPGTGKVRDVGAGSGKGYNANFPLNRGEGDDSYIRLAQKEITDIIHSYQPQLILFSAGFDAHHLDPLSGMKVTTEGFWQMYSIIITEARANNIPFVFALEGGYSLEGLSDSVAVLLKNLIAI